MILSPKSCIHDAQARVIPRQRNSGDDSSGAMVSGISVSALCVSNDVTVTNVALTDSTSVSHKNSSFRWFSCIDRRVQPAYWSDHGTCTSERRNILALYYFLPANIVYYTLISRY